MIRALVAATCLAAFLVPSLAAQAACPPEYKERTPSQVLADLRAATDAEQWDLVRCNYSRKAVILDDQGILVGREDIIAAAQSLVALFDGVNAQVLQETVYNDFARVLWSMDAGWVVIPDGVSTYHIRRGKIRRQTSHGLIEFTGPPPDQQ